jgi:hypothetical protein
VLAGAVPGGSDRGQPHPTASIDDKAETMGAADRVSGFIEQ